MRGRDSARRHLDQRAEALAQKHHRRLQQMTQAALESRQRRHASIWRNPAFGVAAAAAFSVTLAISALLLRPDSATRPDDMSAQARTPAWLERLPGWVRDTETPLDLLENYAFYRWLATQNPPTSGADRSTSLEGPHDPDEQIAFLALAADEYRHRQRYAATDAAARFSGAVAPAGAAQ